MKTILLLGNIEPVIYNFRLELMQKLSEDGWKLVISVPLDTGVPPVEFPNSVVDNLTIDRHRMNPFRELKVLFHYVDLIRRHRPDVVLTFTIKPNIYGTLAARLCHVPCINNVTGVGSGFQKKGLLRTMLIAMQRFAYCFSSRVFFQNTMNLEQFLAWNIVREGQYQLLPGSGIDLQRFRPLPYPVEDGKIRLLLPGRICRDKGVGEYLTAAEKLLQSHPEIEFHLAGMIDVDSEEYAMRIAAGEKAGNVFYHGKMSRQDLYDLTAQMHAIVLPSYHEGMSNSLLEAAASARPVLASDIPGCRETLIQGSSGLLFRVKNTDALIEAILTFRELSHAEKSTMGQKGVSHVTTNFDRQIVVQAYLEAIEKACGKR